MGSPWGRPREGCAATSTRAAASPTAISLGPTLALLLGLLLLAPAGALAAAAHKECAASTGAQLIAALADTAGCDTILLDGVVTLHDGDFPGNANLARATNVTLTASGGGGGGGTASGAAAASAGRQLWAALETSSLLTRHIDVPPGVGLAMSNLYIAGGSRLMEVEMEGERPFSAFSLFDGATATVTGCDVRLAPGSCVQTDTENLAWLRSVDPTGVASPAGAGCSSGRGSTNCAGGGGGGGVVVASATVPVDALHLAAASAAAAATAARARPGAAVINLVDTTLWCSRAEAGVLAAAGDVGGAAVGRAASRVTARVWTGLELASALGRTGSRTIVISSDELTLPPPVLDALDGPEALIQDREIILRGRAPAPGGGGAAAAAPARVIIPLAPATPGEAHPLDTHRQCKQPLLRAGQGGSVALASLTLAAVNPGCALLPPGQPAACSVNGATGAPLPASLRGTILPAGLAGAEPGGSLAFQGVAIEFEDCTPGLASVASAIVSHAGGPGKAALVHVGEDGRVGANGSLPAPGADPAGLVLTCTACEFACVRAEIDLPMAVSLVNVTVACGTSARRVRGGGAPGGGASSPSSSSSYSSRPVGLASGTSSARSASLHSTAVIALAVTMCLTACLAAVAAVVAGLTAASARLAARAAERGSVGAPDAAAAGAAAAGGAPPPPPPPAGPGSSEDDDSAHGAAASPATRGGGGGRGRRRGWVAKLWGPDKDDAGKAGEPGGGGGDAA